MQTSDTCSARTWGGRGEDAEDFMLLCALSAAVEEGVVSSASIWSGNDGSSSAARAGLGERRGEPATNLEKK